MRRAAKVDANHGEIVAALQAAGSSVQSLAGMAGGVPDLLASGFCQCGRAANLLLEVKDGSKRPSERVLTPEQVRWHHAWRGPVAVVLDADAAIAVVRGR